MNSLYNITIFKPKYAKLKDLGKINKKNSAIL